MKTHLILLTLLLGGSLVLTVPTWADDDKEMESQESSLQERLNKENKQKEYEKKLEEKYGLSEQQIQDLHKKGLNDSQITIAAQLAKSSGKSIDDVVKMRLDQKMGWGKIAKELGVPPREIGQSISSMHHDLHKKHKEHETREDRAERKEHREERKEERADRKAERSGKHGKG